MDTIKQTLAAIVGSVILSGCLSDQPVLTVPSLTESGGEGEDNETASLWAADSLVLPAGPGGARSAPNGDLPQLLAQVAPIPAALDWWATTGLTPRVPIRASGGPPAPPECV